MCTLLDNSEGQRGRIFDKLTTLCCHQRRTEGGQHGALITVAMAVITNQCPWCMSTLSGKMCAAKHAQNAAERGICIVDSSMQERQVQEAVSDCPLCEITSADLPGLQRHLVNDHLPCPKPDLVFYAPHPPDGGRLVHGLSEWWQKSQRERGGKATKQGRSSKGKGDSRSSKQEEGEAQAENTKGKRVKKEPEL